MALLTAPLRGVALSTKFATALVQQVITVLRYATLNILTTCATLSEAEDHSATGLAAQTRLETANGVRLRLTLCLTRSALGLRLLPALVARCTSRTSAGIHHAKLHNDALSAIAARLSGWRPDNRHYAKWHADCLAALRSRLARWRDHPFQFSVAHTAEINTPIVI